MAPTLHFQLYSGAISVLTVLNCGGFAHLILLLGITSLSPLAASSHVDTFLTLPVSSQHMEPHSSSLGSEAQVSCIHSVYGWILQPE